DHAARAGAVLYNDRMAEAVGHFRREDSRDDIGAAAGSEADEKLDRPVGIACHLRPDGTGRASQRERESQSGSQRSRRLHPSPLATRYDRPRFILAKISRMNPNFEVHGSPSIRRTDLMERQAKLFRLNVRSLDDLAPLLGLIRDKFFEV